MHGCGRSTLPHPHTTNRSRCRASTPASGGSPGPASRSARRAASRSRQKGVARIVRPASGRRARDGGASRAARTRAAWAAREQLVVVGGADQHHLCSEQSPSQRSWRPSRRTRCRSARLRGQEARRRPTRLGALGHLVTFSSVEPPASPEALAGEVYDGGVASLWTTRRAMLFRLRTRPARARRPHWACAACSESRRDWVMCRRVDGSGSWLGLTGAALWNPARSRHTSFGGDTTTRCGLGVFVVRPSAKGRPTSPRAAWRDPRGAAFGRR